MVKRAPHRFIKCISCDGSGHSSHYSVGYFNGVRKCWDCDGTGALVVYLNSGQVRKYPGGPRIGCIYDLSKLNKQ